jgi:HEPN domain-containing protein
MTNEVKKANVYDCINFLDMGYKFLNLTENSLEKCIASGNKHLVVSNNPITNLDYEDKTKWSDFKVAIPILFNFYHALELIIKGLLYLHGIKPKTNHKMSSLLKLMVDSGKYPPKLIQLLSNHIEEECMNTYITNFLNDNQSNIDNFYEILKYPYNKDATKIHRYFTLKYQEEKIIPYLSIILRDSREIRVAAGKVYVEYRDLIIK